MANNEDMPNVELEELGKILVEQVRDAAIKSSDRELQPNAKSAVAKRWRKAISEGDAEKIVTTVIPDIVDDTIFYLLQAIDQELLKISFSASNGKAVKLEEGLGELSGWYMGEWRSKYSKERYVDDFSDLDLNF